MSTSRATMLGRAVHLVVGVCVFAVGIAGFLGWPRAFDPRDWIVPHVMACGLGLIMVWRSLLPGRSRVCVAISLALIAVGVLDVWIVDVPYPF